MSKFIQRTPTIQVHNPATGEIIAEIEPLSLENYVNFYPLNDAIFAPKKGFHAIMSGSRIQNAFRGKAPEIELRDDDYQMLCDSIEKPELVAGKEMSPELGRQYRPHMDAIFAATSRSQVSKKDKAKAKKSSPAVPASGSPKDAS